MRGAFSSRFEGPQGTEATGRLLVDVEGFEHRPLPIEVRDENLRLLGMAMTERMLSFSPGQYAIRLLLPDGNSKDSLVDISAAGGSQHLTIKSGSTVGVGAKSTFAESKVAAAWSKTDIEAYGVNKGLAYASHTHKWKPQGWFARFITNREGTWLKAEDPPILEQIDQRVIGDSIVYEMEVYGGAPAIYFLELLGAGPQGGLQSVALPLAPQTDAGRCRLVVVDAGNAVDGQVMLLGHEGVEVVSEYMRSGALQEAAALMTDAEGLLFDKISNPIAAALGGYALLRLGDFERLHNWPMNLASWFDWLPDGAVISAELMARRGDHPSAADFLLLAVKRGLPIFSEGMSTLVSRLRYYSLYAKGKLGQGYSGQHIEEGLATVLQWSAATELSDLTLILKDVSLTGQQVNVESIRGDDAGWLRFGKSEIEDDELSNMSGFRLNSDESPGESD